MRSKVFYFACIIFFTALLGGSSCDNEECDSPPIGRIGWFVNSDTVCLNSDGGVFYEDLTDIYRPVPNPMYFHILESTHETISGVDPGWHGVPYLQNTTEVCSISWLTVERTVGDSGQTSLKITVLPNEGAVRHAKIEIWEADNLMEKGGYFDVFCITQEGISEDNSLEVKIRYKGKTYISNAMEGEHGEMIYEDEEFNAMLKYLGTRDDIETVIMGTEGIVDYYDEEDIRQSPRLKRMLASIDDELPIERMRRQCNRVNAWAWKFPHYENGALGFVELFDDNNYSDTSIYFNLYDFYQCRDIRLMHHYGLNDKISSIVVMYEADDPDVCSVLTVWEDSDYNNGDNDRTKHRINVAATYYDRTAMIPNLKSVPCPNSGNSWNDRISSMSFHFGHYNRYPINY